MGAQDIVVQPLNKLPYGSLSSKVAEGVIFLTYSSLISSSEKVRMPLAPAIDGGLADC